MQDDTAIVTLSNQLNQARASRRQAQQRIEQIELEARQLKVQIVDDELTIDRTQTALRALLGDLVPESKPLTRSEPDGPVVRNSENQIHSPRPERPAKPAIHRDVEIRSSRFGEL